MKTCPSCKNSVKPKKGKCPECGYDMSKMSEGEPEPLAEGTLMEGNDLAPLVESAQVLVPKKGKLLTEKVIEGGHTVKVAKFAIIRPCQSKGRAIRGHQPIYEPSMLAENAGVFSGWQMYLDHVAEQIAEAWEEFLQERGRSTKELGGRVLRSWYDPEVALESDEENGFRKGAVVGEIIPYKMVREMLEDDPYALAVSINAWPTKARIGAASWNPGVKGAVIEGIRKVPQGSVDFVPRGGAGGRVLSEEEVRSAVSLLESAYSASRDEDPEPRSAPVSVKKLSEMTEQEVAALTREQLAEALKAENPSLAESITAPAPKSEDTDPKGSITREELTQALNEQREAITSEFKDAQLSEEQVEERANQIVQEREELRSLSEHAAKDLRKLKEAGLPQEYVEEIGKNYLLLKSGARPGILVEDAELEHDGKTRTAEEVVSERIKADAQTAVKLIEAAGGTPRVTGLGPSAGDGETEPAKEGSTELRQGSAFTDFLVESGDITGDADKDKQRVSEMLEG